MRLNITNGDSSVELMALAKVDGQYLPWRDVLHIGPLADTTNLEVFSRQRAKFLSDYGLGSYPSLLKDFNQRDHCIKQLTPRDCVVLWFEHDLYDQLQLCQILSHLYSRELCDNVSLINPPTHLGHHTPASFAKLEQQKAIVTDQQFQLAVTCWEALIQSTPHAVAKLLSSDLSALPFVKKVLQRFLAELPDPQSGINETERLILSVVKDQPLTRGECFRDYTRLEADEFLGDLIFFRQLDALINDRHPLLNQKGEYLALTDLGVAVLAGDDRWQRNLSLPFYWGGVTMEGGVSFYWDRSNQRVVEPSQ